MYWALRLVAVLGAVLGLWVFSVFDFGYPRFTVLIGLWAMAPLPLAYALSHQLARGRTAQTVALVGFATALALGFWAYLDAARGLWNGTESLSGLIVIFGPIYQYVALSPFLLAAAVVDRWAYLRSPPR